MPTWLTFPPVRDTTGRLARHSDPRRAVIDLVRLVGDIRPHQFDPLPAFADPCPQETDLDQGDRVRRAARALRHLVSHLGRDGIRIAGCASQPGEIGRLTLTHADWSAALTIRVVARDPERYRLEPLDNEDA